MHLIRRPFLTIPSPLGIGMLGIGKSETDDARRAFYRKALNDADGRFCKGCFKLGLLTVYSDHLLS